MIVRKGSPGSALYNSGYESKQFTISGAQTDYDVASHQTMFTSARKHVFVKTNVASVIKLNGSTNNSISLAAGEQFEITNFLVTDVYVTTTGDTIIRIVAF